jgi:hypothetical protein
MATAAAMTSVQRMPGIRPFIGSPWTELRHMGMAAYSYQVTPLRKGRLPKIT